MGKRTRLKDISQALNLSITTVSRALNDKDDISPATKQKVLQVANMLNYRPNYFAKFLTEDQNNILGVIVPRVDHSYFSAMLNGVMHRAQELGYFVLLAESFDDAENEEVILNRFLDLEVEGVLISPAYSTTLSDPDKLSKYSNRNVVLIDRSFHNLYCPQITNNHFQAAKSAVNHLKTQGYNRIAHIGGLIDDPVAIEINKGYQAEIKDDYYSLFICNKVTPEAGYDAMGYFMEQEEKPDAIFVISDEAALGVYRYCYDHKLCIPTDIGVVGYSNANFAEFLTPSLTTIEQHSYEMGANSIEVLTNRAKKSMCTCIYDCSLIVRESTKKS